MIVTDGVHMIATSGLNELHEFAEKLGFKKSWLHQTPGRSHYDLTTPNAKKRALQAGAKLVDSREFITLLHQTPEYQAFYNSMKK